MFSKSTRYLLAAVQAIVGYEWFVSGANKVLSGSFPQGLANALQEGLKDNPNVWYVEFVRGVILPQSVAYGYLIQYCELAAGVALLIGALVLCGRLPERGQPYHRLAVAEIAAAAAASFGCLLLCVNLHFWMGDGLISSINTAKAFDEGIDLDTLLPPLSLILLVMNGRLLIDLLGIKSVPASFTSLMTRLPRLPRRMGEAPAS
jgi:thiosulfate dehydrogenase (quinone) large subunit